MVSMILELGGGRWTLKTLCWETSGKLSFVNDNLQYDSSGLGLGLRLGAMLVSPFAAVLHYTVW